MTTPRSECPFQVSLRHPSWELKESYVECLKDFQREDPARPINWELFEHFDYYIAWCKTESERTEVVDGSVPFTTYWIVVGGDKAVGKLTLRHQLTPELERLAGHFGYEIQPAYRGKGIATAALALGLAEIQKRGILEVIIVCEDDNLGSIRVLEKCGGRLAETYEMEAWPKPLRKYVFSP